MSRTLTPEEDIKIVLEDMMAGTEWEGEVLEDTVGWLEDAHNEELDLLFVRAAPGFVAYYSDPDWRYDHDDWHYWTPQLVAGELDLKRLPEGRVRELARELYYGGRNS